VSLLRLKDPSISISIVQCWSSPHANIRQRAANIISVLSDRIGAGPIITAISSAHPRFSPCARLEAIQFVSEWSDKEDGIEWAEIIPFIIQCLDDKSQPIRSIALELVKNEEFVRALNEEYESLSESQKKLIQSLGIITDNTSHEAEKPPTPLFSPKRAFLKPIYLNTSAFGRRARQASMGFRDGITLILNTSFYSEFMKHLYVDIDDVFDEDLANLLSSHLASNHLEAIQQLRNIFQFSSTNFQNTVDIMFRFCGIRFISRNAAVAQSALSLLIEFLVDEICLLKAEVSFMVPIVLWGIAVKSDEYSVLLQHIREHSSQEDFGQALLLSLELENSIVISTIFDEFESF
jgi:hypothetical protein